MKLNIKLLESVICFDCTFAVSKCLSKYFPVFLSFIQSPEWIGLERDRMGKIVYIP